MSKKLLIIGVSGVTCSGKTTVATVVSKMLPNCKMISQDDYFRSVNDPLHVWIPELEHINFDIITSLNMEKMYADIAEITERKDMNFNHTTTVSYQFSTCKEREQYVCTAIEESNVEILIIEGFCIFNYKPLLPFFHLKYYFTLDKVECKRRRNTRVYEPPDCPGYFEECVWPEHLKQLKEVQENVQNVTYFSETGDTTNPIELMINDILKFL